MFMHHIDFASHALLILILPHTYACTLGHDELELEEPTE
jgi:hypothetical protein